MSLTGHYDAVLSADQMPHDNADLAALDVHFDRLPDDTADSCPVSMGDVLRYLADEAPGGEQLEPADLVFRRTALIGDARYWIWTFREPDGGDPAYVTVAACAGSTTVGYDTDYYGLSPEQFMLGDFHKVF
jgi:hypothetical protein